MKGIHPEILERVRGEFLEMPGLRLTRAQAQRLWNLDGDACESVLGSLVEARFLTVTPHGAFVRFDPNSPRSSGHAAPSFAARPLARAG